MPPDSLLPPGFAALEEFAPYWASATTDLRWDRRAKAEMPEIRRFYDAALARAEDIIAYLEAFPLGAMPEAETKLFQLLLALPHAAMAVEFHHQPRALASPFPHGMKIGRGPWPQG